MITWREERELVEGIQSLGYGPATASQPACDSPSLPNNGFNWANKMRLSPNVRRSPGVLLKSLPTFGGIAATVILLLEFCRRR